MSYGRGHVTGRRKVSRASQAWYAIHAASWIEKIEADQQKEEQKVEAIQSEKKDHEHQAA